MPTARREERDERCDVLYNPSVPLNLPTGYSRFRRESTQPISSSGVAAFREMINIIASQGRAWSIYEHFKRYFSRAAGNDYFRSSDESWAGTDLSQHMDAAAASPPVFLAALYDAIESLRSDAKYAKYELPEVDDLNSIGRESKVGFEIHPPDIVASHLVLPHHLVAISKALTAAVDEMKNDPGAKGTQSRNMPEMFDVAITVAGPERPLARSLAAALERQGVVVFYDELYSEQLWGANLSDLFDDIFRRRATFCVMFVSKSYAEREWTNHERQSALARGMRERGSSYVLPVRVDDTDLPGLPPTIGYISLRETGIDEIANRLTRKVRSAKPSGA